jgi:hypothetical protein
MSDKIAKKTKAELHEMLAQAVRNTQPQPIRDAQPEPVRDVQPEPKRKTQPTKRDPRRSTRPKSKVFGHLPAASSGVDNAAGDP